jgi:hypothetical protein
MAGTGGYRAYTAPAKPAASRAAPAIPPRPAQNYVVSPHVALEHKQRLRNAHFRLQLAQVLKAAELKKQQTAGMSAAPMPYTEPHIAQYEQAQKLIGGKNFEEQLARLVGRK